jgi:hypothetical protein
MTAADHMQIAVQRNSVGLHYSRSCTSCSIRDKQNQQLAIHKKLKPTKSAAQSAKFG